MDYWHNVFKEAYPEYRKRYYELFGENNANKDLYLVQDVNKGYTSQIIGHVLSWYNQGRDYVYYDKVIAKAVNNDDGIKYANLTKEYFKDVKAILDK